MPSRVTSDGISISGEYLKELHANRYSGLVLTSVGVIEPVCITRRNRIWCFAVTTVTSALRRSFITILGTVGSPITEDTRTTFCQPPCSVECKEQKLAYILSGGTYGPSASRVTAGRVLRRFVSS